MNSSLPHSVMTNEELLLNLAKHLKEQRKTKGVSQEDVYNDTGIHVARIEQGKRDISFTMLIRLTDYFEITINELRW